ncbi:hypothetical protein BJX99DRAFT_264549 [Aspergillus californicus]
MKYIAVLSAILAPYSLAQAIEPPLEGYEVWEPEWEIEARPGHTINARGTIEEIHSQLLDVNPDWDEDYVKPALERRAAERATRSADGLTTDFTVAKRDVDFIEDGWIVCDAWPRAKQSRIQDGITYLRGVDGRPTSEGGPGKCARVSCSYDSAIWWCNDSRDTKTLRSFADIAEGAETIINSCTHDTPSFGRDISGQAFHKTNWNVIVREASC